MLHRSTIRPRPGMAAALAFALVASACATSPVIDGQSALDGRDLETATHLYGHHDERTWVGGREFYIWRRNAVMDGRVVGCELRVELGFRQMIRATELHGFPAACQLFSVQYTTMPETLRRDPAGTPGAGPRGEPLRTASGCPGCRPVGGATETAAIERAR